MARAAVNIASQNGLATSLYPTGAPAPIGALSYRGNPVHNGVIRIISDGSVDFGAESPFLIQALYTDGLSGGTNFEISGSTIEAGQQIASTAYVGSERIPVHNVAGMPYGVGLAIGDLRTPTGMNDSVTPRVMANFQSLSNVLYDKVFKYEIGIYPATNQANCIAGAHAAAQIKGSWDRFGTLNGPDYVDVYSGVYNARGTSFQETSMATSNVGYIGGVVYHDAGSYQSQMIDATHLYTGLTMRQSYFKLSKTDGLVHSRLAIADQKTMHNYSKAANIINTIVYEDCDRHLFPANVQGIDIALDMHYYVGERVILGRSPARVEICDTATPQTDWQASSGLTKRFAVAIPRAWSRKVIEVKLREQVFAGESLSGKYLHIYGGTNNFLGSILIAGEVI
jgi:hypothetical protein